MRFKKSRLTVRKGRRERHEFQICRLVQDICKLKMGRLWLFVDALKNEERQLKAGDQNHALNDMSNRPADNTLPMVMSFMQHDADFRPSKSIRRILGR